MPSAERGPLTRRAFSFSKYPPALLKINFHYKVIIKLMERLSAEASTIVARLIDKVQDKLFLDIALPYQPTLNIKRFDTVVHPDGPAYFFSVGLFSDKPLFRFITRVISLVVDQRVLENNIGSVQVIPFYYRDDPNEIVQKAAFLSNGTLTLTDEMQQRDICAFMERWVIDLLTDGYV